SGQLQSSGALAITVGASNTSTINTQAASLTSTGGGGNLSLTQSGDLTLNANTLGGGSLSVNATSGNLTVSGATTANGGVTLTVTGSKTITGAGKIASTGNLAANLGNSGPSSINTAIGSLTASGTGGSLTITEDDNITLNASSLAGGSLSIGSTAGS